MRLPLYWRDHYDLRAILEKNWAMLGPKLQGKLHLYCGSADTYFLNDAVYKMEDFLKSTLNPPYDGEVKYGDRAEHCWNGDPAQPNYISRLHYNTMYLNKILERIAKTAPPGSGPEQLAVLRATMKVLVTGGAGYIGSVVVSQLVAAGHEVVVYDNLSKGHRPAVSSAARLVVGDVGDRAALDAAFAQAKPDAVTAFCGLDRSRRIDARTRKVFPQQHGQRPHLVGDYASPQGALLCLLLHCRSVRRSGEQSNP